MKTEKVNTVKKIILIIFTAVAACTVGGGCVSTPDGEPAPKEFSEMYIKINGNEMEVELADNSSVDALVENLKRGDITYTANDYGDFEKVGALGRTLPSSDTWTTTQAGDVMLYSSNQIVIFYGSNAWNYTRLGKINGYTASELRTLLGDGQVTVTLSLTK